MSYTCSLTLISTNPNKNITYLKAIKFPCFVSKPEGWSPLLNKFNPVWIGGISAGNLQTFVTAAWLHVHHKRFLLLGSGTIFHHGNVLSCLLWYWIYFKYTLSCTWSLICAYQISYQNYNIKNIVWCSRIPIIIHSSLIIIEANVLGWSAVPYWLINILKFAAKSGLWLWSPSHGLYPKFMDPSLSIHRTPVLVTLVLHR